MKYLACLLLFLTACEAKDSPTKTITLPPATASGAGAGSSSGDMPRVARVGKDEIAPWEFEYAVNQQTTRLLSMGASAEDLNQYRVELKRAALDGLIHSILFAQEAERRGLTVSEDEIEAEWKKLASRPKPQDATEAELRNTIRRDLLAQKAMQSLQEEVVLTDEELEKTYREALTTEDLDYVQITLSEVKESLSPAPEEIKRYQAEHQQEIERYYREHPEEFAVSRGVKARHILIKLGAKASSEEEKAAREKIEALAKRISAGEAFEEVAREASEDRQSAEEGGSLGWVGEGDTIKPFEEAAFALKEGEISAPVRTPFGFHLIKVEEKREARERPLEEVSGSIAETLFREEKARALAKERAEAILAEVKQGASLAEAVAKEGAGMTLAVKNTGPFSLSDAVPGLGRAEELLSVAHALTKAKPVAEKVVPVGESYVVLVLKERKDADMAAFVVQKEVVRAEVLRARRSEALKKFVKEKREENKDAIQINPDLFSSK